MSQRFIKQIKERYGVKTVMFYEKRKDIFEVRHLDNTYEEPLTIERKHFFDIIPKYITDKYTVVIIEFLSAFGKNEITHIHHPVQPYLNTPPIIQ